MYPKYSFREIIYYNKNELIFNLFFIIIKSLTKKDNKTFKLEKEIQKYYFFTNFQIKFKKFIIPILFF